MAVEVEEVIPSVNERPKTFVRDTDKFKQTFIARPTEDGFVFYEVATDKGPLPAALSGYYSTMKKAVEAIVRYVEKAPKSKATVRDAKFKERA